MIEQTLRIKFSIILLSVILLCGLTAESIIAQCGVNFDTKYRHIANSDQYNLRLDDWNSDGKLDLWRAKPNANGTTLDVIVYAHNGNSDWNWNNPTIYQTPVSASNEYGVTPQDFDSDGDKDIIIGGFPNDTTIYRNNGNGTFTQLAPSIHLPDEFSYVYVSEPMDINGDGLKEVIYEIGVPGQGHSVNYRLANADGTLGPRTTLAIGVFLLSGTRTTGDFNGDGKIDFIISFVTNGGGYVYRIYTNNGNGTFSQSNDISYDGEYFGELGLVKDINNDGKADLAKLTSTRHLYIYLNNGNGTFNRTELPVFTTNTFASLNLVEMNGDNKIDIVEVGETFYSVHLNNGAGNFTRSDYKVFWGNTQQLFFDFNGDSKADRATSSYNNFGQPVYRVEQNVCQKVNETKRFDIDGNGTSDVVIWNPLTGKWSSGNLSYNDNTYILPFNWGSGSLGDIPSAGDFDGDGKTDYSVYRNTTGYWYVYLSGNSSWLSVKFGLPGDIPIPADYNGGGKSDIAVFRPSDGNWYILYSENQQFYAAHFGANGDKPVPADFDGDGKTDLAVFRPNDGNWYIFNSSDQSYKVVHWGISTDIPLPADYDGDGKADITVNRNGDWYFLKSGDNSFGFIHWGTTGDTPMAFYRDDIAYPLVYRAANWNWYLNHYSGLGNSQYLGEIDAKAVMYGLPNN